MTETSTKQIVYIAGKVTGTNYSDTYAKFKVAQLRLEAMGFEVLNPLEHITEDCEWYKAMRQAIAMLVTADHIYLLDDWQDSEGAKVERALALKMGINTIELE